MSQISPMLLLNSSVNQCRHCFFFTQAGSMCLRSVSRCAALVLIEISHELLSGLVAWCRLKWRSWSPDNEPQILFWALDFPYGSTSTMTFVISSWNLSFIASVFINRIVFLLFRARGLLFVVILMYIPVQVVIAILNSLPVCKCFYLYLSLQSTL